MLSKKLLVLVLLLSANIGVDAKRSARKTEKLYRKSGRFVKKLRDVWQQLGVKPFIVELPWTRGAGKVGEPCMLKSEVEAGYLRKSTVSRDYVRKSEVACAGVVEGDVQLVSRIGFAVPYRVAFLGNRVSVFFFWLH